MNQVFTAIDLGIRKQSHYQGETDAPHEKPSQVEREEPTHTASLEDFEKTFESQQERMKCFFESTRFEL